MAFITGTKSKEERKEERASRNEEIRGKLFKYLDTDVVYAFALQILSDSGSVEPSTDGCYVRVLHKICAKYHQPLFTVKMLRARKTVTDGLRNKLIDNLIACQSNDIRVFFKTVEAPPHPSWPGRTEKVSGMVVVSRDHSSYDIHSIAYKLVVDSLRKIEGVDQWADNLAFLAYELGKSDKPEKFADNHAFSVNEQAVKVAINDALKAKVPSDLIHNWVDELLSQSVLES